MSSDKTCWEPSCGPQRLLARATLLRTVRDFFAERGVLEVETPLLCRHTVTDPHLHPFRVESGSANDGGNGASLFLQTSPEFAMKRLLAAGSGSIYQICKAFRNGESGRWHNPEFTLLEWYRVGFGLSELIVETEALIFRLCGDTVPLADSEWLSYREAFQRCTGLDPIGAHWREFERCACRLGFPEAAELCGSAVTSWMDFLFSHAVQPHLGQGRLSFVYDFPSSLPSLARAKPGDARVVERAEVFLSGIELGNGFHELGESAEQERRFDADLERLLRDTGEVREKDRRLLAALDAGLPDCAGIAIGLDRLLMILAEASHIRDVLSFDFANA